MNKIAKDLSEYDCAEGSAKSPADYVNNGNHRKVGSYPNRWKESDGKRKENED